MTDQVASEFEPKPVALLGQRVAFTGRLAGMTRAEAETIVARAAGRVVRGVAGHITMLVVGGGGWPLMETGRVTRRLLQAEKLRDAGKPIRILSESAFRELVGLESGAAPGDKTLDLGQVASLLGVEARAVQRWEQFGLVRSCDGRYDFRDLVSLKTVTGLVSRGVSPVVIRRSLDSLNGLLPGVDRPLAQLSILVSHTGELVAELEQSFLTTSGQMEMRFDGSPEQLDAHEPLSLAKELERSEARDSGHWVDAGLAHEAADEFAEAEKSYRRAAAAAPQDATPEFNLGNVLMATGRLEAASERYLQAVALDPSHAKAWFNLAHAQESLGRKGPALRYLTRAVAADPLYADAHYNLADLAERTGDMRTAEMAWSEYLRLDPYSEWAREARRRLQALRSPKAWA
jgi:tetratricopeptide (TPR) repeat protein